MITDGLEKARLIQNHLAISPGIATIPPITVRRQPSSTPIYLPSQVPKPYVRSLQAAILRNQAVSTRLGHQQVPFTALQWSISHSNFPDFGILGETGFNRSLNERSARDLCLDWERGVFPVLDPVGLDQNCPVITFRQDLKAELAQLFYFASGPLYSNRRA